MTDRVIRDGRVAVLISPDYGAGWSTWSRSDYGNTLLFEPYIVDILLNQDYTKKEKIERITVYCNLKYPEHYVGGLDDLEVVWVEQGTWFKITEYDGAERIEFKEDNDWIQA